MGFFDELKKLAHPSDDEDDDFFSEGDTPAPGRGRGAQDGRELF